MQLNEINLNPYSALISPGMLAYKKSWRLSSGDPKQSKKSHK